MKYVFFAPYMEMVDLAREVCEELKLPDWHIEYGYVQDCIEPALRYAREGAKAFVSRGITADILEKAVDIPVIRMTTSPYDIIPLLSCLNNGYKHVAVIGFPLSVYGINGLNDSFWHKFIELTISSVDEIPEAVKLAKSMGVKTVIGGKNTVLEAEKEGLTGILFQSGKSTIAAAMNHAMEVVAEQQIEKARSDRLRLILDFCSNGIIVTDQKGIINFLNKLAYIMLKQEDLSIIGKPIHTIFPDLVPSQNQEAFYELEGSILKLENNTLLYNITPIVTDEEITGNIISIQYVQEIETLADVARKKLYQQGLIAKYNFNDIITQSSVMLKTINQAKKYAPVDSTILITGQTGTGKEMLAQSIHNASHRSSGPFVAINCAAIPESLLESELFGYESGAFTGAGKNGRKGFFELASGGTLFLDEIGEMSISLQSTLLRVLQERSIIRVGGNTVIPIDVRIICATHQDLQKACDDKRFRLDLYHRINVLRLNVPALNERTEDVPILTEILIRKKAKQLGLNPIVLSSEVLRQLNFISWSGNVRELEGVIERMIVLKSGQVISLENFMEIFSDKVFDYIPSEAVMSHKPVENNSLKKMEKQNILDAYHIYNGNRGEMCKALSISKSTLWRKLKSYGITD